MTLPGPGSVNVLPNMGQTSSKQKRKQKLKNREPSPTKLNTRLPCVCVPLMQGHHRQHGSKLYVGPSMPMGNAPGQCPGAMPMGNAHGQCPGALPGGIALGICPGLLPQGIALGRCPGVIPQGNAPARAMPRGNARGQGPKAGPMGSAHGQCPWAMSMGSIHGQCLDLSKIVISNLETPSCAPGHWADIFFTNKTHINGICTIVHDFDVFRDFLKC